MTDKIMFEDNEIIVDYVQDYYSLSCFYKEVFTVHNIFQKKTEEVVEYLKKTHKAAKKFDGGYYVGTIDGKLICAFLIRRRSIDTIGKHAYWKLNHLGVDDDSRGAGLGRMLLDLIDKKIINLIREGKFKTAKLEIDFCDSRLKDFYSRAGFEVEGKSRSKYRYNEDIFLMGKIFDSSCLVNDGTE